MNITNFNPKKKIFIIAEIGNNHEGNFNIAKKLIKAAAKAKVDAVKFQTFITEDFVNFNHPSYGGGGAHKCCSNVININKSISIEEWLDFCKNLDINIKNDFIIGIKSEMKRLENFLYN